MSDAVAGIDEGRRIDGAIRKVDAATTTEECRQMSRRTICRNCDYPSRTCLCPSLPPTPLCSLLRKCRIVVMQHPHELRRKNRSLPLVELCMFGGGKRTGDGDGECDAPSTGEGGGTMMEDGTNTRDAAHGRGGGDFVMKTIVCRRFGDHCDVDVMNILRDPNEVIVLVFPHKNAMGLEEGLRLAEERCGVNRDRDGAINEDERRAIDPADAIDPATRPKVAKRKRMTIVYIDATWKHAREMEMATENAGVWPDNLIRVQMTPTAPSTGRLDVRDVDGGMDERDCDAHRNGEVGTRQFVERRFRIRTPPSPDHLCTAESIAWISSRVEGDSRIYEAIMRALDYMVETWSGFVATDGRDGRGSGESRTTSQKRLRT